MHTLWYGLLDHMGRLERAPAVVVQTWPSEGSSHHCVFPTKVVLLIIFKKTFFSPVDRLVTLHARYVA